MAALYWFEQDPSHLYYLVSTRLFLFTLRALLLFDVVYTLLTGHLYIYMVKIKIGLRYFAITIDA